MHTTFASPEGAFPGGDSPGCLHLRTAQSFMRLRALTILMPADSQVSSRFPEGVPPNPVTVSGGVRNLYRRNVHRRKG